MALYLGYKRRNAHLDKLDADRPAYLKTCPRALAANTFEDVNDEATVDEVREHLFNVYNLLDKVISARRLHHKHFYPQELDYGHKAYIDRLVTRRQTTLRALEALEKRRTRVLYEREKWFSWVRQAQEDEESRREKEQKRVKLEAALWKRHWRELETRLRATKEKEDRLAQEAFLDEAWKERLRQQEESAADGPDDDQDWDPIEDVVQEDRDKFLDLLRHFLWLESPSPTSSEDGGSKASAKPLTADAEISRGVAKLEVGGESDVEEDKGEGGGAGNSSQTKGKDKGKKKKRGGKKKGAKKQAQPEPPGPRAPPAQAPPSAAAATTKENDLDKSNVESKEDIRRRLRSGVTKDLSNVHGMMMIGTIQNPTYNKIPPMPEDEIEDMLRDITEIKTLLFCRQLLSHATLLPIAMRSSSVDEFLADPALVDSSELRDLCLQVEKPTLQALRDACADFARGDADEEGRPGVRDDELVEEMTTAEKLRYEQRFRGLDSDGFSLMDQFLSRNMRGMLRPRRRAVEGGSEGKDSKGEADEEEPAQQRMKIRVCGRSIWNYASEDRLPRSGWLQFSIMAKDCSFDEAVGLCRNFDEFEELNLLARWNFFPTSKWNGYRGDWFNKELGELGLFPFWTVTDAAAVSHHLQTGSRGQARRQHQIVESRNLLCATMKRNHPVTRRFIQYLIMHPRELLVLVRDARTGHIITAPPKVERWLTRVKAGVGRASKNVWKEADALNAMSFETIDAKREYRLSFNSYYDIYIWDYRPGCHHHDLLNLTLNYLRRAHKIRKPQDQYHRQKHVLQTLYQDRATNRVRQMRPGDDMSVFDVLTHPTESRFAVFQHQNAGYTEHAPDENPFGQYGLYNDADAAEDEVLFPMDKQYPDMMAPFKEIRTPIDLFEEWQLPKTIMKNVAGFIDRGGRGPFDADDAGEGSDGGDWDDDEEVQDFDDDDDDDDYVLRGELEKDDGDEAFMWDRPPIWEYAADEIAVDENLTREQEKMLDRVAFFSELADADPFSLENGDLGRLEVMERDRSYVFKQAFHLGDVEPGAQEKYAQVMRLIVRIQNQALEEPLTDWAWFCIEILDWLNLQAYYDEYQPDSWNPWPHRYIVQDITQAFVTMALFFPDLPVSRISRGCLDSPAGAELRASQLFDPLARAATLPDRRTSHTSHDKPPKFWAPLEALEKDRSDCFENLVPMEWSKALRSIIAQLYKSGVIGLEYGLPTNVISVRNQVMAAEEPHRPGKLDMFVRFPGWGETHLPPFFVERKDWPQLLPLARAFANRNDHNKKHARFAVLRIWSAPHFWPNMIGLEKQQTLAFHDVTDRQRVWKWRFAPKDMPAADWAIYNVLESRMRAMRDRLLHGDSTTPMTDQHRGQWAGPEASIMRQSSVRPRKEAGPDGPEKVAFLDDHVAHRADVILVMGKDQTELLRTATLVTFAMQGKPWLREVDLWKSFINVDLELLEKLDPYWLD